MRHSKLLKSWLCSFSILFLFSGCVTVPKQTAVLNTMLGTQIAESKKSHLSLIDEWVEQRKGRTEAVLYYHWIPNFIINFLKNPMVKKDMDKIVCGANGEFDRALIIRDIVDAIAKQVEEKRKTLFEVIESERGLLRDSILAHYAEIERMHGAISSNIQSAVKGGEFEKDIREALGRPLRRIAPIDRATNKIEELLDLKEK